MRILMIVMMLSLPTMTAKASDAESQLTGDAIAIMRAAILCPADDLPDRAHAALMVEELFMATGRSLDDAQRLASGLITFIVKNDPPLATSEEVRACQYLAYEAGPYDFIERIEAMERAAR